MPLRSSALYLKTLGRLTYYSGLLKTMHYLAELTCVLVLTYTTYASLQKGPLRVKLQPPPVPFFPPNSTVPDFYQGDIFEPFSNILQSDVALVMYYAPWDFDSQLAREEFLQLAQEFQSHVYFAAINCWVSHGECREQFPNIRSFPMVFAYIRGYKGIQYQGPLVASYMRRFLQSVIHPLSRINSSADLLRLQTYHNAVVVGHFNFSQNIPPGFHHFYSAALKHLDSDPLRSTAFACVTNQAAADSLNLRTRVDNGWDIRLYLWNETLIYPNVSGKLDVDKLVGWVSHRYHSPVNWLSPTGRKSFLLQNQLYETGRPSLVLFADRMNPNQGQFLQLKEVALSYTSCKASTRITKLISEVHKQVEELKVGRTLLERSRSIVQCSGSPRNLSVGASVFGPRLPRDTCSSVRPEEQVHSRLAGLGCRTNRSLNFYAMDSRFYGSYGLSLGAFDTQINPDDTVAVIIDAKDETTYVMKGQATQQSLEKFVLGYAKKSLNRHLRSSPVKQKVNCRPDEVCVEDVSTNNFEDVVLRNTSDVLLFYRKPNCVFCDSAVRVFLKAAHLMAETRHSNGGFSGPKITFAVIDGERNDLPWHLSVDRYPTLVFFPAFRKSQSRVFPHEEELTAASLMQFIVSQLTPKQQMALFFQSCTSVACLREASKRNYRKAGQLAQQIRSAKFRLSCLKTSSALDNKLRDNYIDSLQRNLQLLKQERQLVATIQSHVARQLTNMEVEKKEKELASGIRGL